MAKKSNVAIDNAPTTSQVIRQGEPAPKEEAGPGGRAERSQGFLIDRSRKLQELDRLHRATDGALGEALKKEAKPVEAPGWRQRLMMP